MSNDHPAAPAPLLTEERPTQIERPSISASAQYEEGPTRSERPSSRPTQSAMESIADDIHDDIISEIHKLPSEVKPVFDPEPATGQVSSREIIATPAGLFRRMVAFLVDGAFLSALFGSVLFAMLIASKAPKLPEGLSVLDALAVRVHDSGKIFGAVGVLAIGIAAAYVTLFAVVFKGRTLGRALAGIRLVDQRGGPPSAPRALIRALLSLGSFAFFFVGFWWALFDRRGQTLHDKLCSTFIVRLGARRT